MDLDSDWVTFESQKPTCLPLKLVETEMISNNSFKFQKHIPSPIHSTMPLIFSLIPPNYPHEIQSPIQSFPVFFEGLNCFIFHLSKFPQKSKQKI